MTIPALEKKDVVVLGGGGAGTILLRRLLPVLDPARHSLTLVNARPYTIFLPTTVRMAVTDEGALEDHVLIPFDRLLGDRGRLVVGTAVAIEGGWVVLKSGEKVHYDVLVLAPGTRLDDPLDYPEGEEEVKAYIAEWRRKFKDAEHIVMGGGGPVNIEIAGELKEYFPEKTVTIVQSRALPFNDVYKDNFRRRVLAEARAADINFVLEDHLDVREPKDGLVRTRKGVELRADLIVTSHGGTPATGFLESLGPATLDERGLVVAEPTLELPRHPGVFVVGDAVANAERNRLGKYPRHAATVVPNILARLRGEVLRTRYRGSVETLRVSIGKDRGVIYFGVLWGIVIGSWLARRIQSAHLLLPKARRIMGYGWR
ncbi:hypothetical protein K488DRAFT_52382 [Vararia minispora EC-137]|uniref:Uncharacterized protein n=1 Tax=Vararia minispora EC-137 TaxID=1314806 RepID=A0ACB8QIA1_9AGAM|nr:hypothetical protein K488DRAFT_52382 [Vararia minispora EC-137]